MKAIQYTGGCESYRKGAVLHGSAKRPGYFQVSWFDEDGFSGDSQFETRQDAERELKFSGYSVGGTLLQEVQNTHRFKEGNDRTWLVHWANQGANFTALWDAYQKGGLNAARVVFLEKAA